MAISFKFVYAPSVAPIDVLPLVFVVSFGQSSSYPQKYFRDPLGIPLELVANFGELRPNHWHMGLDIRTLAMENLPVYAAADGFISHIGVRPQSFGRFIIIDHPNGMSTLYGHLNDFSRAGRVCAGKAIRE